ncbi:MAG TPA: sigma-70 family RNA polymerase sigma factor [Candidatus Sulfotelmatobacter sp.]|jgi:RNA polymerase sigma-70 factor (ECF subfamily)|nr:sigma-70 family RNA polymerase sigma factor [Candidatus Sulfotelmatobacter sp.]
MTDEPGDERLVAAARGGDEPAFGELVRRYQGPIYNAVLRMVRDAEDARDLSQTVFLKAFRELGSFNPRYKFYSWIYRIAINESLNHLKRSGRQEPLTGDLRSGAEGAIEALVERERDRQVQDEIMRLRPDHRAVLVLRHFLDLSYEDIAEVIGVPEKTVKSRLFSARQELKDRLVQKGVLR